ncbi:MAG TPA: SMR family transporter [Acidisphaera sp.]|nr:SMR family transporter [Acidisphaera sp.]
MSGIARSIYGPCLMLVYTLASSMGVLLIKSFLTGAAPLSLSMMTQALVSPTFVIGFSLYVFSFAAWIGLLASMPLSTAYPLAIGLTMTCSSIGAAVWLGERIDLNKIFGMTLVFCAVVLFSLGSRN